MILILGGSFARYFKAWNRLSERVRWTSYTVAADCNNKKKEELHNLYEESQREAARAFCVLCAEYIYIYIWLCCSSISEFSVRVVKPTGVYAMVCIWIPIAVRHDTRGHHDTYEFFFLSSLVLSNIRLFVLSSATVSGHVYIVSLERFSSGKATKVLKFVRHIACDCVGFSWERFFFCVNCKQRAFFCFIR